MRLILINLLIPYIYLKKSQWIHSQSSTFCKRMSFSSIGIYNLSSSHTGSSSCYSIYFFIASSILLNSWTPTPKYSNSSFYIYFISTNLNQCLQSPGPQMLNLLFLLYLCFYSTLFSMIWAYPLFVSLMILCTSASSWFSTCFFDFWVIIFKFYIFIIAE